MYYSDRQPQAFKNSPSNRESNSASNRESNQESSQDNNQDQVHFYKMHGTGNDFAIFDLRNSPINAYQKLQDPQFVREISHRHLGIGFDQMLLIEDNIHDNNITSINQQPETNHDLVPEVHAFMRIINADGSAAMQCGNGARCVGRLLAEQLGVNDIKLNTPSGVLKIQYNSPDYIAVEIGSPTWDWEKIPLVKRCDDTLHFPLHYQGINNATALSMGNPHLVCFVNKISNIPFLEIGEMLSKNEHFVDGTNVEIVEQVSEEKLKIKVWERGTGITLACGSGAAAVAAAAYRRGLIQQKVQISLDGGELEVTISPKEIITIAGPATHVYQGMIKIG